MYREFNSGYGNNNGISRSMHEGNYNSWENSRSSRGYKLSKLENLGDYKVITRKINLNAPVYSSV